MVSQGERNVQIRLSDNSPKASSPSTTITTTATNSAATSGRPRLLGDAPPRNGSPMVGSQQQQPPQHGFTQHRMASIARLEPLKGLRATTTPQTTHKRIFPLKKDTQKTSTGLIISLLSFAFSPCIFMQHVFLSLQHFQTATHRWRQRRQRQRPLRCVPFPLQWSPEQWRTFLHNSGRRKAMGKNIVFCVSKEGGGGGNLLVTLRETWIMGRGKNAQDSHTLSPDTRFLTLSPDTRFWLCFERGRGVLCKRGEHVARLRCRFPLCCHCYTEWTLHMRSKSIGVNGLACFININEIISIIRYILQLNSCFCFKKDDCIKKRQRSLHFTVEFMVFYKKDDCTKKRQWTW